MNTATFMLKTVKLMRLSSLILATMWLSACTIAVPSLQPKMPQASKTLAKLPIKAMILSPSDVVSSQHQAIGMVWIGMAHTWNIDIGRGVLTSSDRLFGSYFSKVDAWPKWKGKSQDYHVMIRPRIKHFEVSSVSMRSKVDISFEIRDIGGKLVHEIHATGHSPMMGSVQASAILLGASTPFLGDLIGKFALKDSANKALADAYKQVSEQMDLAFSQGVFDRDWYSYLDIKTQDVKPEKYRMVAERLFKSMGCPLAHMESIARASNLETYRGFCDGNNHVLECQWGNCVFKSSQKVALNETQRTR